MSVKTKETKTNEAPADAQQLSENQPTPPGAVPAPDDPKTAFAALLAKFTAEFGATHGAQWAAEGKSYEEALKLHAAELSAQLASQGEAKDAKIAELETKLAAVDKGEKDAVSFSESEKPKAAERRTSELRSGKGAAAMASLSKLPANF